MKLLENKKGLIMGVANERSIAWGIAQKLSEHGAELAFTYVGDALKKRVIPLAESLGSTFTLDASLIVMDEATSALDLATESSVFDTLRGLAGSRTIVLITHRTESLEWADEIHVLNRGRVVASGTFEELGLQIRALPETKRTKPLTISSGTK